jgi:hypothetical protein
MYVQAQTPEEIDEVKAMTTRIVDTDCDGAYISKELPVIGIEVRAMIDMMAFIGAYGHKSAYESARTREPFRMAFSVYAMEIASQNSTKFWDSWKDYRMRFPVGERRAAAAAARPVSINSILGGDNDDEDAEAGSAAGPTGAAGPAAGAAGPAAAAAEAHGE